jgi:outer membrane protein OmpA-like peptidoglycan-associated protein
MSFNLISALQGAFNSEIVKGAAAYNGESESAITKSLSAAIPASIAGIINKAEGSGVDSVITLAKDAYKSGILGNLASTFTHEGGGIPSYAPGLLTGLFGHKYGALANALSSFSGIKGSTSSSLLGSVVPMALAYLGKHVTDSNMPSSSVASMLNGIRNEVTSAVPAGFNLHNTIGMQSGAPVHQSVDSVEKSGNNWLLPLLLTLAGLALLWYLMKGCNSKPAETTPAAVIDTVKNVDTVAVAPVSFKVKLPNGTELDAAQGGIEDLLVAFLNKSDAMPGKDNWFDFNDLNFETNTNTLTAGSQHQLENIVAILKAYPKVKVKIGGYTDKVGDEAANKKLSQTRAEAILAALKGKGVGAQVTGAEGYGSQFAKFPADAPDADRIKDRRVSLSVREK